MSQTEHHAVIRNKILLKGVCQDKLIFIPEDVNYLERHAFPWENFVRLKNEKYLECFVRIWFSLPDSKCNYFAVTGKRNVYQIFRRNYCPFPPFVRHKKVPREEVYASPEFTECVRLEKIRMAGDLYRYASAVLQHVRKEDAGFLEFSDFDLEIDDTFYQEDTLLTAVHSMETEPNCQKVLKANLWKVISLLPYWIYENRYDSVQKLCNAGLIPEEEIDSLINTAIEYAQESGNYEIQLILTEYKYQHFPKRNPADKLKLE